MQIEVRDVRGRENNKISRAQFNDKPRLVEHQLSPLEVSNGHDKTDGLVHGIPMKTSDNIEVDNQASKGVNTRGSERMKNLSKDFDNGILLQKKSADLGNKYRSSLSEVE